MYANRIEERQLRVKAKLRAWQTTLLTNGILLGSGVASGVLLARILGVDDRGLLAAITYWPHFIVGILTMGVNEGVVIQIASRGKSNTIAITAIALAVALAIVAATACWVLLGAVIGEAREGYLGFARAYAWVLAPSSYIFMCLLAVYQGEMRFTQFNGMRVLQACAYPVVLACLWAFGFLTVKSAAWAALLGGVVMAAVLLYRFLPELGKLPRYEEACDVLRKSVRLHAVNVMMSLTEQVDKIILVIWASNAQLGKYVVAYTAAAAGPSLLAQTYVNVMLPAAARSHGNQLDYKAVINSLTKLSALIAILGTAMIAALPLLLPLAFGVGFTAATPYAQVLTIALSIYGVRKCMVYLLRSWQISRPSTVAEAATALCILAGGYPSYAYAGVLGLCWLLVIAQTIGTALIWHDFLKAARSRYPAMN